MKTNKALISPLGIRSRQYKYTIRKSNSSGTLNTYSPQDINILVVQYQLNKISWRIELYSHSETPFTESTILIFHVF